MILNLCFLSFQQLKEDYERKIDKLQSQLQELTNSSEETRLAKQEVVDHNVAADQRICDLTKRINGKRLIEREYNQSQINNCTRYRTLGNGTVAIRQRP